MSSPVAQRLLAELRGLGVELHADGQVLRFRPAQCVAPALRASLLEHKRELLDLLRTTTPPGPDAFTMHVIELFGGTLVEPDRKSRSRQRSSSRLPFEAVIEIGEDNRSMRDQKGGRRA